MNQSTSAARDLTNKPDRRGITQFLFVISGVGIIVGGLWSLYMGNAPYHPEDTVTRSGVFLASD